MKSLPARLRAAIVAGDTIGALALAERHLAGTDREAVTRAHHAMMDPDHVAALGRNPAHDIMAGVAIIKATFGDQP